MWLQKSLQKTRDQEGGRGTGIFKNRASWGWGPPSNISIRYPPSQSAHQTAGLHCWGRWCSAVKANDGVLTEVLTPCQFTGCSFGLAAIWQYESVKFRVQSFFDQVHADWLEKLRPQKRGDFRKEVNLMDVSQMKVKTGLSEIVRVVFPNCGLIFHIPGQPMVEQFEWRSEDGHRWMLICYQFNFFF